MNKPHYLNLSQARQVLAEMGVALTHRQIQRAAETDGSGQRKLPFFIDPIEKKLKIEKQTLISIYQKCQEIAENNVRQQ